LVADPVIVSDLSLGGPFGGSDHACLTLLMYPLMPDILQYNNVAPLSYCDWDSVNWDQYWDYCNNVSWDLTFSTCRSSDDIWNIFKDVINKANVLYVPHKIIKSHPGKTTIVSKYQAIYTNRSMFNLENKKLGYWKTMSNNSTPLNKARYKNCVTNIKKMHVPNWL